MPHRVNDLERSAITYRHHPTETLGRIRLQDDVTGETLLVPQPSTDPNDPLNWYVVLHSDAPLGLNIHSMLTPSSQPQVEGI
jgi:hypothetical protein